MNWSRNLLRSGGWKFACICIFTLCFRESHWNFVFLAAIRTVDKYKISSPTLQPNANNVNFRTNWNHLFCPNSAQDFKFENLKNRKMLKIENVSRVDLDTPNRWRNYRRGLWNASYVENRKCSNSKMLKTKNIENRKCRNSKM